MSQYDQFKAKVLEVEGAKPSTTKSRWLEYDEQVEVLWLDGDNKPHLSKGEYIGLRIPTTAQGGPVKFVVEEPTGNVVRLNAQHVVGITPVGSTRVENN